MQRSRRPAHRPLRTVPKAGDVRRPLLIAGAGGLGFLPRGRGAMMSTPRAGLMCGAACLAATFGCDHGGAGPRTPSSTEPTACFTMRVSPRQDAPCSYLLDFILDPTCSSDDSTLTNDLEVRWDYDGDQQWDTSFGPLDRNDDFRPDPSASVWRARCQVRDREGHIAEHLDSLAIGPYPTAPDIIAGHILFEVDMIARDTVRANEPFDVSVCVTSAGEFSPYKTVIWRDAVRADSSMDGTGGTVFGCACWGHGGWVITQPGLHVFTVLFDADNAYTETNEHNNSTTDTLVVVP
jgi:hypothetical protein